MSRIIYPADFASQRTLFQLIKAKHDADGAASVLMAMLAQKNISLSDDATTGNSADTQEANRSLISKQAENFRQARDLVFTPVFSRLKSGVQFLKSFYKPKVQLLGNWGITVNNGRIGYPVDFSAQAKLFHIFKAAFDAASAPNPLTPYITQHNIDMNADETATNKAIDNHKNFVQAAKDAEIATEKRNNLWNPTEAHLRIIGDFLKKLFNDNEKKLGEWGFTVDASPQAAKERTSTVKPASQVTINAVIVGGTFTNIGAVDLHVYKSETITGTPSIVNQGEMLGMNKGYSTITVVNPSTTVEGKFKVLRSK